MTQEEKDLLLKDLSGRLTCGVKIKYATSPINHCVFTLTALDVKTSYDEQYDLHYYPKLNGIYYYFDCLPYLRKMSSMTDEEIKEYKHFVAFSGSPDGAANFIDWLNANHFDYRNLIERGLAIEAPGGMYNSKT